MAPGENEFDTPALKYINFGLNSPVPIKSKLLNKAFQDLTCAHLSCLDLPLPDLIP